MFKNVLPQPWFYLSVLLVCLALPVQASDMRLLIDISGSMKQNDPQNLRIPAVNLLLKMAPTGSTVGVWTFGHDVSALVPDQAVSERWKRDALAKAKRINSSGLYTNIGGALETVLQGPAGGAALLLTDGMVDISKDPAMNVIERHRIISTVLPRLRERGTVIHAVALSDNADTALLEELAESTGGISEVARSPADLTRIFVRLFDDAIEQDRVPLQGNVFMVDSSIEEFTLLVFRNPEEGVIQLRGPGQQFHLAGDHPDFIQWYQDQGYELITVKAPVEGSWELFAIADAENRVTVLSDLQLKVSSLLNTLQLGDAPLISVEFLQDDERIVDSVFLDLLDVQLIVMRPDNTRQAKRLGTHEGGVFTEALDIFDEPGRYLVKISVDGKTFQREFVQTLDINAPAAVVEHVVANDVVLESAELDDAEAGEEEDEEDEGEGLDLQRYGLYAALVLGNLLVFGVGIAFYRSRQRRLQQAPDEELQALLAGDVPAAVATDTDASTEVPAPVVEPEAAEEPPVAVADLETSVVDGGEGGGAAVSSPDSPSSEGSLEDSLEDSSEDASEELADPTVSEEDARDIDMEELLKLGSDGDTPEMEDSVKAALGDEIVDEEALEIRQLDSKVAEILSDEAAEAGDDAADKPDALGVDLSDELVDEIQEDPQKDPQEDAQKDLQENVPKDEPQGELETASEVDSADDLGGISQSELDETLNASSSDNAALAADEPAADDQEPDDEEPAVQAPDEQESDPAQEASAVEEISDDAQPTADVPDDPEPKVDGSGDDGLPPVRS
jgi:hypothetical protein